MSLADGGDNFLGRKEAQLEKVNSIKVSRK
jgi:hypothetical protein